MALSSFGLGVVISLRDSFSKNSNAIEQNYKKLEETVTSATAKIDKNLKKVTQGFKMMVAGGAIIASLGMAVKTTASFEFGLARVGAVSQASQVEMAKLEKSALDLGASTAWTARQVTEAEKFLAMSGFSVHQNIAALPGVLSLATAGATDLGRTSEIASNVLRGFGLEANKMGNVADILTQTFTSSNTTLESLGETLKFVAPIASKAGVSLGQVAAMAGLLGNVGIKGTMAGTALRGIMIALASPTDQAAKALKKLHIETVDFAGDMKNPIQVFKELSEKLDGMGSGTKLDFLNKIFNRRTMAAVAELIGKEKTGGITKFLKNVLDSSGAADRVAKRQLNNLTGSTILLQSAWEGFSITVGSIFTPILKVLADGLTGVVRLFKDLASTAIGRGVIALTAAFGALLVAVGAFMVISGGLGLIIPKLQILLAGFGITTAITAETISTALAAAFWPLLIGIAVIVALKKAWDSNLGGIQDNVLGFFHTVSTVWDGIVSLISSGSISTAMRDELQKMGLFEFVKTTFLWFSRLQQFFAGFFEQVGAAFADLGSAFLPAFSGLFAVLKPIGSFLFSIAKGLGLVNAAIPSKGFKIFGQILGFVVGVPLRILAGMIKTITIPLKWIGVAIGFVIEKIASVLSAIPSFLLPKGVLDFQQKMAKNAEEINRKINPPFVSTHVPFSSKFEPGTESRDTSRDLVPSRFADLLSQRAVTTNNTFSTVTETNNLQAGDPADPPLREPIRVEVPIILDGDEIHRAMVNRDRDIAVREDG